MKNKNILVTGGCGFIGSNFIPFFIKKYSNYNIINLDLLTYAGDKNNLNECNSNPQYKFVNGDIRDRKLLFNIFEEFNIEGVVHFAARIA